MLGPFRDTPTTHPRIHHQSHPVPETMAAAWPIWAAVNLVDPKSKEPILRPEKPKSLAKHHVNGLLRSIGSRMLIQEPLQLEFIQNSVLKIKIEVKFRVRSLKVPCKITHFIGIQDKKLQVTLWIKKKKRGCCYRQLSWLLPLLLPGRMTGTILADFAIVATAKERPTDKDALMLYFLRFLARRVDDLIPRCLLAGSYPTWYHGNITYTYDFCILLPAIALGIYEYSISKGHVLPWSWNSSFHWSAQC